ncbi:hypothetical protein [Vogesella sp. XCS3]|uniref:hypothetical protein n=1 Tax=Vogesella sp. XCS3 TaxID=2877939 RepID=UPI001D0A4DF3|nr:hypothetical protein [Vogesella sp. XCS3]UDM18928.1 hypothetical protein LCH97_17955 [Vogesella sp. XCS3]
MKIVDATPPKDFPAQVVVMQDRAFAQRNPSKAFYLRVVDGESVKQVDLDNAVTPLDARRIAIEQGFEPTHWIDSNDGMLARF